MLATIAFLIFHFKDQQINVRVSSVNQGCVPACGLILTFLVSFLTLARMLLQVLKLLLHLIESLSFLYIDLSFKHWFWIFIFLSLQYIYIYGTLICVNDKSSFTSFGVMKILNMLSHAHFQYFDSLYVLLIIMSNGLFIKLLLANSSSQSIHIKLFISSY